MKQLILTISPEMWERFKLATAAPQGTDIDESLAERIAQMYMWKALSNIIIAYDKQIEKEGKNE